MSLIWRIRGSFLALIWAALGNEGGESKIVVRAGTRMERPMAFDEVPVASSPVAFFRENPLFPPERAASEARTIAGRITGEEATGTSSAIDR